MLDSSHHGGLGSADTRTWVCQNRDVLPILCPKLCRPALDVDQKISDARIGVFIGAKTIVIWGGNMY